MLRNLEIYWSLKFTLRGSGWVINGTTTHGLSHGRDPKNETFSMFGGNCTEGYTVRKWNYEP